MILRYENDFKTDQVAKCKPIITPFTRIIEELRQKEADEKIANKIIETKAMLNLTMNDLEA